MKKLYLLFIVFIFFLSCKENDYSINADKNNYQFIVKYFDNNNCGVMGVYLDNKFSGYAKNGIDNYFKAKKGKNYFKFRIDYDFVYEGEFILGTENDSYKISYNCR